MLKRSKRRIAIIGGGIAGTCTSALLSRVGYDVVLFEKSASLGGCAGSFVRNGFTFNTAATTIAGLSEGFPVERIISRFNVIEKIKIVDPIMVVHTPRGLVRRFFNLERTLDEINRIFPNRGNYKFWQCVYDVTSRVLRHNYYHNFSSIGTTIKSLTSLNYLIIKYFRKFLLPALKGIKEYLNQIDKDYYDFMDSHVRIVAQSSIENVNFLTLLLSLGYPFTGVGYPEEGMGALIENIAYNIKCLLRSEVKFLKKREDLFIVGGDFGEDTFDKVIVAFPVLENLSIIKEDEIRSYLNKYVHLITDSSAIVAYGVIKKFRPIYNFHLKILSESLPFTTSPYLFFSFNTITKNYENFTVFTISTHTKASYWTNLPREIYYTNKEILKKKIIELMKYTFQVEEADFKLFFISTPMTFLRYLGRRSVGGIPITIRNSFWRIPSNFSSFKNVYFVGDSFFCYQGWIGVLMGVKNLVEHFNEKV